MDNTNPMKFRIASGNPWPDGSRTDTVYDMKGNVSGTYSYRKAYAGREYIAIATAYRGDRNEYQRDIFLPENSGESFHKYLKSREIHLKDGSYVRDEFNKPDENGFSSLTKTAIRDLHGNYFEIRYKDGIITEEDCIPAGSNMIMKTKCYPGRTEISSFELHDLTSGKIYFSASADLGKNGKITYGDKGFVTFGSYDKDGISIPKIDSVSDIYGNVWTKNMKDPLHEDRETETLAIHDGKHTTSLGIELNISSDDILGSRIYSTGIYSVVSGVDGKDLGGIIKKTDRYDPETITAGGNTHYFDYKTFSVSGNGIKHEAFYENEIDAPGLGKSLAERMVNENLTGTETERLSGGAGKETVYSEYEYPGSQSREVSIYNGNGVIAEKKTYSFCGDIGDGEYLSGQSIYDNGKIRTERKYSLSGYEICPEPEKNYDNEGRWESIRHSAEKTKRSLDEEGILCFNHKEKNTDNEKGLTTIYYERAVFDGSRWKYGSDPCDIVIAHNNDFSTSELKAFVHNTDKVMRESYDLMDGRFIDRQYSYSWLDDEPDSAFTRVINEANGHSFVTELETSFDEDGIHGICENGGIYDRNTGRTMHIKFDDGKVSDIKVLKNRNYGHLEIYDSSLPVPPERHDTERHFYSMDDEGMTAVIDYSRKNGMPVAGTCGDIKTLCPEKCTPMRKIFGEEENPVAVYYGGTSICNGHVHAEGIEERDFSDDSVLSYVVCSSLNGHGYDVYAFDGNPSDHLEKGDRLAVNVPIEEAARTIEGHGLDTFYETPELTEDINKIYKALYGIDKKERNMDDISR